MQQSIVVMRSKEKRHREIALTEFLAAWIFSQRDNWQEALEETDALTLPLPKGPTKNSLSHMRESQESAFWYGVDWLLRRQLGPGSLDTLWATDAFFSKNAAWMSVDSELRDNVLPAKQGKPRSKRPIQVVRLTPQALEYWMQLPENQRSELMGAAEREFEADCDYDEEPDDDVIPEEAVGAVHVEATTMPLPTPGLAQPIQAPLDRAALIERLVHAIAEAPFQPYFRRLPYGKPVLGWEARLNAYFWPNPKNGRAGTERELADMIGRLAPLAQKRLDGTAWTEAEGAAAVEVTTDIFKWGGVRRSIPQITVDTVRSAIDSAIAGKQVDGALMNSAWTKLASLASATLPPERQQAIWDSRVSHSLIGRLDALGGESSITALFPRLGWIPGQGGNRRQKPAYAARWKRGYRSWEAHFEAAAIVREMVDYLNRHTTTYGMPAPGQRWSVRDVEMVLFMDGY